MYLSDFTHLFQEYVYSAMANAFHCGNLFDGFNTRSRR